MTIFDHAWLGANLALACGSVKKCGPAIAVMAAVAGAFADWDGLTVLAGPSAYARGHRTWGHNVPVSLGTGMVIGIAGYFIHRSPRVHRRAEQFLSSLKVSHPPSVNASPRLQVVDLSLWIMVGGLAGISHLPSDWIYSGGNGDAIWPIALFWPFSHESYARPILGWGDLGATFLFIAEMFALYRWPAKGQLLAWIFLASLMIYVLIRAVLAS